MSKQTSVEAFRRRRQRFYYDRAKAYSYRTWIRIGLVVGFCLLSLLLPPPLEPPGIPHWIVGVLDLFSFLAFASVCAYELFFDTFWNWLSRVYETRERQIEKDQRWFRFCDLLKSDGIAWKTERKWTKACIFYPSSDTYGVAIRPESKPRLYVFVRNLDKQEANALMQEDITIGDVIERYDNWQSVEISAASEEEADVNAVS